MKRTILFLVAAVCWTTASAVAPERKMLEQDKMWVYTYNHFEATEEGYNHTMWMSYYQLKGDTVIDGRQYMKMYRWDDRIYSKKYYGAFREDEEGRVYMYLDDDGKDKKMIDFSYDYEELSDPVHEKPDSIAVETIKMDGRKFRRYRYFDIWPNGDSYSVGCAVEGVGFENVGLAHYLFEGMPTCVCDYESLAYVSAKDFYFFATGFNAPKEIELTDDERQLIASNNDFAFRLFGKARTEENCILSPLSITYALGMLNNGAAGQTQEEINKTLGFGNAGAINAFCQKMLKEANTLDAKTKALIANTVFVNEGLGYRLQDGFVQKANDYYDAQPQSRDFRDGQTMDVINQWASDHTMGMIPMVLNENTFNPYAVSYLLNALYFKGVWNSPFDVSKTWNERFDGGQYVPMMHKTEASFEYTENDTYQAVRLPYGNGAYNMSVYLPREGKTITDVLSILNGSKWQVKGRYPDIDLKLPRFETDSYIPLEEIMSDLGMPTAFTQEAEFPYFCNVPVYIGMMFQVAKIKLDEEGTEAAAVTVIGLDLEAEPDDVTFHANRPFLYVISEQSTDAIFFIGQYTGKEPKALINGMAVNKQQSNPAAERLYNLSGQRLSKAPSRGLYIRNGRLVISRNGE